MMLYPCQVCSAPGGIANTWWSEKGRFTRSSSRFGDELIPHKKAHEALIPNSTWFLEWAEVTLKQNELIIQLTYAKLHLCKRSSTLLCNQANQLQLLISKTLQNCRNFSIFAQKGKGKNLIKIHSSHPMSSLATMLPSISIQKEAVGGRSDGSFDTWGIGEAAGNDDNLGKSHGHMAPKPQQADALDKWDRWYRCLDWSGEGTLCNRHLQGSKSLQFRNTCHHEWPFPPENPTPAEIPAMVVSTRPHGPCTTFVSAISAGERPRSRERCRWAAARSQSFMNSGLNLSTTTMNSCKICRVSAS